MPQKPEKQEASFSIDDFIGEIEKAEDLTANKRLPQERLKNKRQLDNAARRAAEAAGLGDGKLKPQPLIKKAEGPLAQPKLKKATKSAVTGMTLKSPKSKANSVDRIDFGGFGEPEQAGFGHVPSR
jgi:excinuclease ABC subunit B